MWHRTRRLVCLGFLLPLLAPATEAAPPQRIVSLNLCADQILIDLVPRQRIAALSHLAGDPQVSPIVDRVGGIPLTRGEAETVLALRPDLVIAGLHSTPATVALLERLGHRIEKVPSAGDIAGIRSLVRQIARAVGAEQQGEALVAAFDHRINASRDVASPERGPAKRRPTALVYQVNGLTSGANSLVQSVLDAAGFENLAAHMNLGAGGQIALETLVSTPPDLLILTGPVDEYRTAVAANLRHPALVALRQQRASIVLPWRHWLCGTHHIAIAVESLVAARARIQGGETSR